MPNTPRLGWVVLNYPLANTAGSLVAVIGESRWGWDGHSWIGT